MKFRVFWDVTFEVTFKLTDVSEVPTASIIRALTMEAVHINFNATTWRYIPEDFKPHP
jgi:hypothetical protein